MPGFLRKLLPVEADKGVERGANEVRRIRTRPRNLVDDLDLRMQVIISATLLTNWTFGATLNIRARGWPTMAGVRQCCGDCRYMELE